MEITAGVVKQLREKTGVGMMECKNALVEAKGDLGEAEKILRKKGLAAAANKAGRATGEGVVAAKVWDGARHGVLVEVNCETDFAARGADFQAFVTEVLDHAADKGQPSSGAEADANAREALMAATVTALGDRTLEQRRGEAVGKIGENMQVRRFVRFDAGNGGRLAAYIHTGSKIGVLVDAEAPSSSGDSLEGLLRDVAMHIAAAAPRFVTRDEVSETVLSDEREIAREQAAKSGKPPQVVEKIVSGRMEKFYQEACLTEQPFVKDPDKTVGALLAGAAERLGGPVSIRRFARFVLGEAA